ncbi:hypothetical protein E2C06_32670 [Dankookia rubra]|uniref:Transposase DDE domain-containing protein n=1 Tax=Dankookia rubra TaxID=1442381 RepID=A0A4R5Q7K8_9PROT|nr:transposase [Dankookia rubra]TDH58428.1 hypothetical protein E2C06_32670 [Dankookia rubra]
MNHVLCRGFRVTPHNHRRKQLTEARLGERRWPVEGTNAWLLENRRLALRFDRLGYIVQSLIQAACIFLVADRIYNEF